nr:hypothetical protein [Tanacetum cinerariifolium]
MPSDCLKIIERKSKVRQSRAKAVVAKVNSNSSTPAISSDVAELKDMVRALLIDKKNQSLAHATSHTPAPIKAMVANQIRPPGFPPVQNNQNNFNRGNTFTQNRGDALDSAAGGNFLDKIPRECLLIIESKSKQIVASLEDKLDIRMNRFEKSLNDMKASFITPTAPIKAVEE